MSTLEVGHFALDAARRAEYWKAEHAAANKRITELEDLLILLGRKYERDALRGTGRTTRMLEDAKKLARHGRAVYVICASRSHAGELERALGEEGRKLGIKCETPSELGNFDWTTLSLRYANKNCVVLVDHYTIEYHFGMALEMLHRYDA